MRDCYVHNIERRSLTQGKIFRKIEFQLRVDLKKGKKQDREGIAAEARQITQEYCPIYNVCKNKQQM